MRRCPKCKRTYNDESLNFCLDDGEVLVYGPGRNSDPATAILKTPSTEAPTRILTETAATGSASTGRRRMPVIIATVIVLLVAGFIVYRSFSGSSLLSSSISTAAQPNIKSLAVLPLKPLDASDNYIGMGIADAVIRRISQTSQLTVRPTSAIRKYLNDDTDALTAAKQLNTDAILEGSVQRADDRLRISVNLLRTSDGASLWNDSFVLKMTDIFAVQDTVSQQIASRLNLKLDPTQQAGLTKRYTSNPEAYEYYQKAIYSWDQRVDTKKREPLTTIELFKQAIVADPNFALAHAQLAYAYSEMATFTEPTNPKWAELVNVEGDIAQRLDPQLAEIHLARSLLLWSSYGGFQTKAAIRELLAAQQLNPNVGHAELAGLYSHVGLRNLTAREIDRATEIDPTGRFLKSQIANVPWLLGEYDEWVAETHRELAAEIPDPEHSLWYLLGKRQLDEAQKRIDEAGNTRANDADFVSNKALFFALKGNFKAAEDLIPTILSNQAIQNPYYHHVAYKIATVYALGGKSAEAVKWLQTAADTGFPCYPRFERDSYLDRVRQTPEFIEFMSKMKTEWETYKTEFGEP
jgi:TolB-like protein